jgi:transposase-like protein
VAAKRDRVNASYSPEFKLMVCKEYYNTGISLHGLADKYEIYPQMVVRWRKMLKDHPELKGLKKKILAKGSRKPAPPPKAKSKVTKKTKATTTKKQKVGVK